MLKETRKDGLALRDGGENRKNLSGGRKYRKVEEYFQKHRHHVITFRE